MDGDVDAARANDAEALAIYEELGATASAARTLAQDLCAYEYAAGNFEVALRHAADALAMFRRLGDADGVARALVNVSICLVALARYDEAERGAIEALDLTRYDGEIAWPLQQLGTIGALRRHATAKRALEEQTRAARLMGFVDTRIAALGIVRWATGQKEYERVIGALREALGSKQLESLMAAGAAMTDRAAIDEALRD
jgi:tetratricopeptide (TPR) repeat protein